MQKITDKDYKDWLDSPVTEDFLNKLKAEARGIRLRWFQGYDQTLEDRGYVEAVERIITDVTDSAVEYTEREIDREDKADG